MEAKVGWGRVALRGLAAAAVGSGCQILPTEEDGGVTTDRMVPRSWKGNPWGPEADAARRRGELPTVPIRPDLVGCESAGRAARATA